MKKLLFAVTALAALSLLAPSTGFADGAMNQLGCYTDDAMTSSSVDAAPNSQTAVYVVLSNPYDHTNNVAIDAIGGIEFQFVFEGSGILLGGPVWTHPNIIDVGNAPSHIVGYGSPQLVTDGTVTVGVQTVMIFTDAAPSYLYLIPANPPSIPGFMATINSAADPLDNLVGLYPASGADDNPVFGFNGPVVATDNVNMDQIKAMYR